jgi:hypothetical protein
MPYALFQGREGGQGKLICLTFAELFSGTYRYYLNVDKFGIGWGYDVPTIRIFDEDGLISTINAYNIGEGNYWHVCDINGSDGTITLIDQWLTGPPPMAGASGNLPGREDAAGSSSQSSGSRTFSWDFGDGGTSAEQNPVHTYSTAGTYTVSLSVSDGVSEVITTKENYIGVGVSRVPEQAIVSLSLRPNPACKEIHIDWVSAGGFRHGAGWQIFDSRGRMAMTGNWEAHMSHDLRIDISGLARGIYFIRVTDQEGNGGCYKFIAD